MNAELLAHGDYNVINVDWGGLRASKTLYTQATANSRVVAAEIVYLLKTMKVCSLRNPPLPLALSISPSPPLSHPPPFSPYPSPLYLFLPPCPSYDCILKVIAALVYLMFTKGLELVGNKYNLNLNSYFCRLP